MHGRLRAGVAAAAVLGLGACGQSSGTEAFNPADCPDGLVQVSEGGLRMAGVKGHATPEAAAEGERATFDMGRTRKLIPVPQRIDTVGPDAVRLFYADASGKVVLQIDVGREALGWFAGASRGCGRG